MIIPPKIEKYISQGYQYAASNKIIQYDSLAARARLIRRKWQNLCNEARYDIPRDLWEYVDWAMPVYWHDPEKLYKIKSHEFVIKIPNLLPLSVKYKEYQNAADWYFSHYEIITSFSIMIGKKQEEFSFFLHLCYELNNPHSRAVKIEQITSSLSDGVIKHPLKMHFYNDEHAYSCYG